MQTIGAYEAKTHFSSLLEQVEKGEHVIITKHGHAVAKLVPANQIDQERSRQAIMRLKALQQESYLDGLDWKNLRDEGRR